MKAYSVDLRERVVEAVEGGAPRAQVAGTFGVGLATLKRWVARGGGTLRTTCRRRRRLDGPQC